MKSQNVRGLLEILLVEDNPGDVRLTTEVFKEGNIPNRLSVVRDGVEALSFLRRESRYAEAVRPDIVLLDLNLPKKNGYEVLAEIKADSDLKCIPVIVLTSSHAARDILKAYNLHANCYVTKPADLEQFNVTVKTIGDFWLTSIKLPAQCREDNK